jgi:glycosyltransferase involved in cell wall biosynthesis
MKYILITPAHNEEGFIRKTLESMSAQTTPPERWIIVDDGSTDHTAAIVDDYAKRYPWIQLLKRPQRNDRSFAGKAYAFYAGIENIDLNQFDIIGNLDADLSFDPDYLEFLMSRFSEDPKLGVAGTPFIEDGGYDSARDSFEGENHVAGGCQLFRRECFSDVGGYVPNPAGGIDWIAVTMARMKGWTTRSFPQKRFRHHRSLGTAGRSGFGASFSYGEKDYYLGNSPIWELFRVIYRMAKPPFLTEGLALLLGYFWAAIRRMPRPVSRELMRFHRQEQMIKLRAIFQSFFSFKKLDSFSLLTDRGDSH